ncbi:MAG: sigma-70 family RNA polymerase sigma factor [Planctomycetales bacterium]|nr:sigma-70 family RNA polymerase sigma factor [Planctomycetales bacterium]
MEGAEVERREEVPSDEALMASFQGGDRGAYRTLVDRHAGEILNYATRLVGDRGWAEDLTQDVFLRLWLKGSTFKAESKLSTWLYRVARNACLDFLKRRKHEPRLRDPAPGPASSSEYPALRLEAEDPAGGPERALERAELRGRVEAAIAALPERFRAPFVLCVLQGLSYDEAGAVLGCSVKTVSSRLSRARTRFRKAVAPYLDDRDNGGRAR